MNDSGPLLSTIASAGATIVAIVGGLLVTRYVTLDGEQQVSRRRVAELRRQLDTAVVSRIAADANLSAFEAEWVLDDEDLYELLLRRAVDRLIWSNSPSGKEPTPITLDDVQREVDIKDFRKSEAGRRALQSRRDFLAEETATAVLPINTAINKVDVEGGGIPEWDDVRGDFLEIREDAVWEFIWDAFKSEIHQRRQEDRLRRQKEAESNPFTQTLRSASLMTHAANYDLPKLRPARSGEYRESSSRLRRLADEAKDGEERLTIAVELAEQALSEVIKPRGLILGLSVLVVLALTGVVLPVLYLIPAPADLQRSGATLIAGAFFLGLVTLFVYLGHWAWLLARENGPALPRNARQLDES